MSEYVLTVSPGQGSSDAFALYRDGEAKPVATHAEPFDAGPIVYDGVEVEPAACFTPQGLLDQARNEAVGNELWHRITPGDVGIALQQDLANSLVYVDLPPELMTSYPWELLRHANFWLLTGRLRICLGSPRSASGGLSGQPPESDHPLRVLVVLGNHPDNVDIRADEELLAIEAAAHLKNDQVLLRALLRPSSQAIQDALAVFRPHVFHFIGHGVLAESGPLVEVFGVESGVFDPWDADRIRGVFPQSPPRLVVLNACLTGAETIEATSLVTAFLDTGCLAVVAMMGEITGDASHAFSKRFYTDLFDGKAVDVAASSARSTLANLADGLGERPDTVGLRSNWPLPRLVVAGDVNTVVTMTKSVPAVPRRWMKEDFVARWDERWEVCKAMDGTPSRFALVTGGSGIGKSELVNTIADTCARHGERVLMVDVGGKRTGGGWRDVLRAIADAAEKEDRDRAGGLKGAADAEGQSLEVIRAFQRELAKLSTGDGVLVVLDGLSEWEANIVRNTVLPELCEPYLNNTAPPGVRMVVSMRDDWVDVWEGQPQGWRATSVGPFQQDEWKRAVRHIEEYWLGRLPKDQAKRDFLAGLAGLVVGGVNQDGVSLDMIRRGAKTLLRHDR